MEVAWQGAAAGFATQAATQAVWNEYGGQSQMDKEKEIPQKVRFLIQLFHALTALFIGLAAFINIVNAETLGAVILCVYLFCFSGMICAFETPLKVGARPALVRCLIKRGGGIRALSKHATGLY